MQRRAIHLDYDAVDFVGKSFALGFFLTDEGPNLIEALDQLATLVDLKAGCVQRIQSFPMPVEQRAAILQQGVGEIVQPALGSDGGFELADCARGRVAGIGENRQPFFLALLVHSFEGRDRHEHLAAHFEVRRNAGLF